ncbi:MAG: DUF4162 domain-containing protein, partial [Candidatus Bathyarchaeia archaeon]
GILSPELVQEIRKLDLVKDVYIEDGSLSVSVDDAESTLPYLMNALKNELVEVEKISISKPTLDDVFLKYAGTRLEEKGRVSEVAHMRYMIRKG